MSVKYPEFVDIDKIKENPIDSSQYRYSLEIPFNDREDRPSIMVVLKNPSKANINECDMTISRVCNAAYKEGYGKIYIYNLFPYRSTDPKAVYQGFIKNTEEYNKHMNNNKKYLSKDVCFVEDVVFAWGTNTIRNRTNDEYNKVKTCIKSICRDKNLKMVAGGKKEPLHGLRWRNNSKFVKCSL